MSILELCDSEIAAVPVEASAAEAIRMMLDYHVGAVGIVDGEKRIAGIFQLLLMRAGCWGCVPFAIFCSGASTISLRNWIRWSSMWPTTDRAAKGRRTTLERYDRGLILGSILLFSWKALPCALASGA